MLAMAQRHLVEIAFRRLLAHQQAEALLGERRVHGAQPSGRSGCPGGVR